MAQKRMLDKKISISEKVANLSIKAQLLFTWMIPHSDDLGLIPYSPRTIKAMVVPMWDDTVEDIGNHLEDIRKQDLIQVVSYRNTKYYHMKNFFDNQTLKKDRNPQSILPLENEKEAPESWKKAEKLLQTIILESLGNHLEDIGNHLGTEVNRREENIRGIVKGIENTPSPKEKDKPLHKTRQYIKDLQDDKLPEEMREFLKNYKVSSSNVKTTADKIINYENSHGKKYKDYRATICNWLENDFGSRKFDGDKHL